MSSLQPCTSIVRVPDKAARLGTNEHFPSFETFVTNIACLLSHCPTIDFILRKNSERAHGLVCTK